MFGYTHPGEAAVNEEQSLKYMHDLLRLMDRHPELLNDLRAG